MMMMVNVEYGTVSGMRIGRGTEVLLGNLLQWEASD
jgi:hypothetical protein